LSTRGVGGVLVEDLEAFLDRPISAWSLVDKYPTDAIFHSQYNPAYMPDYTGNGTLKIL
jgi:hypothetical protein